MCDDVCKCCAIGLCCQPGSPEQLAAVATGMVDAGVLTDRAMATSVAAWVLSTFDLAPLGSLRAFTDAIGTMVKTHGRGV